MTGRDPALQAKLRRIRKLLRKELSVDPPPYIVLREIMDIQRDPFSLLGWMVAYEENDFIRKNALGLTYMALQAPAIPEELKQQAIRGLLPELRLALRDEGVPDDHKLTIGPLLELCGQPLPPDEYHACFVDFDAAVSAMENRIAQMAFGLAEAEEVLASTNMMDATQTAPINEDELRTAMKGAVFLIKDNPVTGSAIACVAATEAHRSRLERNSSIPPLDMVADLGGPAGCWFLSVLAQQPGRDALAEHAQALVGMLAEKGVRPRPPSSGTFSHGLLTNIDGLGSQSLMLFSRDDDGALNGTSWMLNDIVGIKDYWTFWGNGEETERALRSGSGLRVASCDLDLARELVANALALHAQRGVPPPSQTLLGWHMLGAATIRAQARPPKLDAYKIDAIERSPKMVEQSNRLAGDPVWQGLHNPPDEGYAMVLRVRQEIDGNHDLLEEATTPARYDEYIGIMERTTKDILIRRMAANLKFESLADRANTFLNRLACNTWIALKEDVVPFHNVPYIEALAMLELDMIVNNVECGYTDQRSANAARMELDREGIALDDEADWLDDEER